MAQPLDVVAFSGSLRAGSYNTALLRAAQELAPSTLKITHLSIADVPLFNQDLETSMPESVKNIKAAVKAADAVLFVTPEYNYSVPGVLKNAIDWTSRPYGDNSFEGKAVGIMSASGGMLGGARAQYHLRQCFVFLNGFVMNRPEAMVPFSKQKFDENGTLTDEETRKKVADFLVSFEAWIRKFKA
jgi:chromate reductase